MANACKQDGYVVSGYAEDTGLIQRLLHRAICYVNSDNEADLYKIARNLFQEHLERSVKYGGRTAESVINDYLVNPHYIGNNILDILEWAESLNLELYNMYPSIEMPFIIDSPYFKPISTKDPLYQKWINIVRMRWQYAMQEDKGVFGLINDKLGDNLNENITSYFDKLSAILQTHDYSSDSYKELKELTHCLEDTIKHSLSALTSSIIPLFEELNKEVLEVMDMVVRKKEKNEPFDFEYTPNHLFKGYNGLGTSYVIFHKKVA